MKPEHKKTLYLSLWVVTGALLGVIVGALIEYLYIYTEVDIVPATFIYALAIFTGIVFGLWVGPIAWHKIYVEGARGKNYIIR